MIEASPNGANLEKYNKIRGSLLFLIVWLLVLNPIFTYFSWRITYRDTRILFDQFPAYFTFFQAEFWLSLIVLGFSFRAGIKLWRKKSDAVKATKLYLLITLLISFIDIALPYICGLPPEELHNVYVTNLSHLIMKVIRQFILFWVIFKYLSTSKRIKSIYG